MAEDARGTGLFVDEDGLIERLDHELSVIDWRALVVVVVAAPGLDETLDRVLAAACQEHGIPEVQLVDYEAQRDEAGRRQLSRINRARDSLLKNMRLIWLHARSPADVRFLREEAPDLLSAIDLFAELRLPRESDWEACRHQLCELMKQRHGTLDFTGWLPASVEQRELPLDELYQPLVDLGALALRAASEPETSTMGLLVLGHPGAGKTTFVRHLAWTYAQDKADPLELGKKVPLLLSLSDYGNVREHDRIMNLEAFLPQWLDEQGISGGTAISEHLDEILLLLDGLDELRSPIARRSVLDEVGLMVRRGRVGGVVVTGRSFLVDELRASDRALHQVSTRAVRSEEIKAFLSAFVALRRGPEADAGDLYRRIKEDRDLVALARTPLMLAFMAILDEFEGRLPDRKIEIYYRLGEMLVDRWTKARSIGTSGHRRNRPTRADALRVLGPLAWWAVEQGGGAVREADLEREIQRIEEQRETTEEAAKRASMLLDLLRRDTALLVPRPGHRWSFVHSSIGEYFAGIHAERNRDRWNGLLANPFRPEWREIVLFCAGQLGVIEGRTASLDELVESIMSKSRRQGRYDAKYPSLLIGLLQEAPGLSRTQLTVIARRLMDFILTKSFSQPAAWSAQFDYGELLFRASPSVADVLSHELEIWFTVKSDSIRWDRVFASASLTNREQIPSVGAMKSDDACFEILGPLVVAVTWFGPALGVGSDLLLTQWRNKDDWRYRIAEWLASAEPEQWKRPFGEVARELGLIEPESSRPAPSA